MDCGEKGGATVRYAPGLDGATRAERGSVRFFHKLMGFDRT